jgi:hypothetical protein
MRITIDCPECESAKLPLRTCETCGAAGGFDDIDAWRRRLHAHHRGVILAEPRRPAEAAPTRLPLPVRVVVSLHDLVEATETLIVPDTVAPPTNPLSFDWDDHHRRLRRLRRSA